MSIRFSLLYSALFVCLSITYLTAQNNQNEPTPPFWLGVETSLTSLPQAKNFVNYGYSVIPQGGFELNRFWAFSFDLPLSLSDFNSAGKNNWESSGQFDVGNPKIEAHFTPDLFNLRASLGVRLPLSKTQDARKVGGVYTNPITLIEFFPGTLSSFLTLEKEQPVFPFLKLKAMTRYVFVKFDQQLNGPQTIGRTTFDITHFLEFGGWGLIEFRKFQLKTGYYYQANIGNESVPVLFRNRTNSFLNTELIYHHKIVFIFGGIDLPLDDGIRESVETIFRFGIQFYFSQNLK